MSHFPQLYIFYFSNYVGGGKDACKYMREANIQHWRALVGYSGTLKDSADMGGTLGAISRR